MNISIQKVEKVLKDHCFPNALHVAQMIVAMDERAEATKRVLKLLDEEAVKATEEYRSECDRIAEARAEIQDACDHDLLQKSNICTICGWEEHREPK